MFAPKLHKYTLQRELYVYAGNYKATMVSLIQALSARTWSIESKFPRC